MRTNKNSDKQWFLKFELYKEYKSIFNREPKATEEYKGVNLYLWYDWQKKLYLAGELSEERKQLLIDSGFVFGDRHDYQWNRMFELYKEFKSSFGREPGWNEKYKGFSLGRWCGTQINKNASNLLLDDRKEKLVKAGVSFYGLGDLKWNQMLQIYKDFKLKFGREPRTKEIYEGVNLGIWYSSQRDIYKRGALLEEREQLLRQAGFPFIVLKKETGIKEKSGIDDLICSARQELEKSKPIPERKQTKEEHYFLG